LLTAVTRLTVHADLVKRLFRQALTADFSEEFWRLYGDLDGRAIVTTTITTPFVRQCCNQPLTCGIMINDNNGLLTATELLLVRANIGKVF